MTDLGNPIPRGTIDTEAPLVDEALAARAENPSSDAADALSALKAEIDDLRSRIAERQSEAASKVRGFVRDRPMGSLMGAVILGYALALVMHAGQAPVSRRFR